jgi:pilus assembly protein Flp/PilA
MRILQRFFSDEDGPTAVEYAVMLGLVIVVMLGSVAAVGNVSKGTFESTSGAIERSTADSGGMTDASGTTGGTTDTGGKTDGNANGAGHL